MIVLNSNDVSMGVIRLVCFVINWGSGWILLIMSMFSMIVVIGLFGMLKVSIGIKVLLYMVLFVFLDVVIFLGLFLL